METDIKNIPKSRVVVKFKLTGDDFFPYIAKSIKKLSEKVSISGFRQGKAPANIVQSKIGERNILDEAANVALNDSFQKIVKEKNIKIIGNPQAKIEKISRSELEASIEVSILPEIKLPDYKKISKEEEDKEIKVDKEEVEKTIERIQKSRAKFSKKSGCAKKGDQVEINCEIRNGGVKIEGGDIRSQKFILGEWNFVPGFEEKLISMERGKNKKFSLKTPSDFWRKELQEKILEFDVEITDIFKVELPEINDDFAISLGKFKTLKELKENILKGIKEEKEKEEKERWKISVAEKVAKSIDAEFPDILIEKERDRMLDELREKVKNMGLSFEDYLSRLKKPIDELKKDLIKEAEKKVKTYFSIYKIAETEKINVSDEEIEKEMSEIIKNYPNLSSEVETKKDNFKNYVKENILQRKVFEFLFSLRKKHTN